MRKPSFREEKILWKKGYIVIGIDEVGRGAFAGPVVVGAVVFPKEHVPITGVNDSKLLNPQTRDRLSQEIMKNCKYAIAQVNVSTINKVGIGKATEIAFRKAIKSIMYQVVSIKGSKNKHFVLIDGFHVRYIRNIGLKNQKAIVKGDQKSISIAAASIIAKVYRDRLMKKLGRIYPQYGFSKHKGYGTKEHQLKLKKYGLSKIHRTSFNLSKFVLYSQDGGQIKKKSRPKDYRKSRAKLSRRTI